MLRPFGWQAVVTDWQFAPIVTGAVVVLAALYLWGVWRVARRHPARPWPAWRTGLFLGGLAVVVLATESGIGTYDDVLFWDHMVQHLMLLMVAPPLLIFGQPITLLLHASRNPVHSLGQADPAVPGSQLPHLAGVRVRGLRGRGDRRAPDRLGQPGRDQPDGAQRRARPVPGDRLPLLPAHSRP